MFSMQAISMMILNMAAVRNATQYAYMRSAAGNSIFVYLNER